ncbi:hypothetical protein LOC69_17640 [Blastopirellula sp. JC733]|nr:hypothetical protein [Blastopirellula sediminis]
MHGLPNMADEAAWYAKHHPDLEVGSVIPEIRFNCRHEYSIGDSIVCRDRNNSTIYTISSLIQRENQPPLLTATSPEGRTLHFAVTQVRPHRDDDPRKADPAASPWKGYF